MKEAGRNREGEEMRGGERREGHYKLIAPVQDSRP